MKKILILVLALFSINALAEDADTAIHNELRQVLKTVTESINSGEYEKMLPVLSEQVKATPITQEFISGKQEIAPYFERWFGPDRFLKKLTISFIPDITTELSADKTWGVVYGRGVEKYTLSDGRTYDLNTRWTATLVLEDDHWKIRSIHIGTDFMDNPLLTEAKNALIKGTLGGAVGGLLAGILLGFFIFRKKKR